MRNREGDVERGGQQAGAAVRGDHRSTAGGRTHSQGAQAVLSGVQVEKVTLRAFIYKGSLDVNFIFIFIFGRCLEFYLGFIPATFLVPVLSQIVHVSFIKKQETYPANAQVT